MGIELGGPSRRDLRSQDAQRLKNLDGPELRAALGETTWTSPQQWSGVAFWLFALVCLWLVAWDCLSWGFTGERQIFDESGPPGTVGWVAIIFLTVLAVVVTTVVLLILAQRPTVLLDSNGITYREFRWGRSPTVYEWAECRRFKVRYIPLSGGGSTSEVLCTNGQGTFTLDERFGNPVDLATILNAYRTAYRGDECGTPGTDPAAGRQRMPSPAMARSREAQRLDGLRGPELREALGVSTWTSSRTGGYVGLGVVTVCGGTMAAFFASATGPIDPGTWVLIVGIFGLVGCAIAWFLISILNPPWVRLDDTGATVGGARSLRPSPPPELYRWQECGPFTLHTTSGEHVRTVAQCTYRGRELKFENGFGDPHDLVAILNAYRSVYGSSTGQ